VPGIKRKSAKGERIDTNPDHNPRVSILSVSQWSFLDQKVEARKDKRQKEESSSQIHMHQKQLVRKTEEIER
jgi:hypothetical protein